MIALMALMLTAMVPHATFRANDARALFYTYLPLLVTNRIINKELNGHLSKVISLLKTEESFMICSVRGTNAFVCTDNGSTHILEAVMIDQGVDALMDMMEWHASNFPGVDLRMAGK
tara:strand:+ start:552 stop:902 length:351 start_codon:yes stop_codon:yes gene_type:complete